MLFFGLIFNYPLNVDASTFQLFHQLAIWHLRSIEKIYETEESNDPDKPDTLEVLTPALYIDAMLGKCSGCEEFIRLSRSTEALKDYYNAKSIEMDYKLKELESIRCEMLLNNNTLDPFNPCPSEDLEKNQ